MSNIIKTGLACYGLSGRVFHAPFLHCHPQFELTAVLERTKSKSLGLNKNQCIVRDYKALIELPEIELIVVNTPSNLHYSMVKQALLAGKHVVVEKPFVPTVAEAEELIRLAKNENKMLSVYHNRRWEAGHLTVKKLLSEKTLGQLKLFKTNVDRWRAKIGPKKWKEQANEGAGLLYDIGSHQIDEMLTLFGWPERLYADIRCMRELGEVDDYFDIQCFYQHPQYGSLKAVLSATLLSHFPQPAYQLYGTKASFNKQTIDVQESLLSAGLLPCSTNWADEPEENWGYIKGEGMKKQQQYQSVNGNYSGFYENIYQHLRQNKPLTVTADQALDVIKLINFAQQSSASRSEILIQQ